MKSRLVIFILTSILLVIGINVQAQKQWTLEECIEYAFDNNIQIKQSVLNVNSADRDVTQSKYGLAPNLNATASHQYGWGR